MANPNFEIYLAYAGGVILLLFGSYYLFVKSKRMACPEYERTTQRSPWRYVAKGVIINGLSPMVFLFWVGTVSFATSELGYDNDLKVIFYFGSIVLTVLSIDVLKAKLRLMMSPKFVRSLNIALGILLLIFGSRLIFQADQFILPFSN